ncbi:hypothetical protein UFOVP531_57 [uncultured Caudovirales phage]|uniref:Uncharacterized protein n=1 Tax=uncultured Caudovirales phage TaxID=2100421 RepID=A0A6J5MWA5_9CAUD|nr:hypothetical protein UFOVP531_57 [uncultured Caudovirales phage]
MKQYFLDLKLSIFTGTYFAISFTDVDATMKVLAFILASGYTLRRWYLLEKNKNYENRD